MRSLLLLDDPVVRCLAAGTIPDSSPYSQQLLPPLIGGIEGDMFSLRGLAAGEMVGDPSDGLEQVAEHLKKLDRNTFEVGDLRVWSPSSDRLSAWAPLLATEELLREAFESSVNFDIPLLVPRPAPPPKPHVRSVSMTAEPRRTPHLALTRRAES